MAHDKLPSRDEIFEIHFTKGYSVNCDILIQSYPCKALLDSGAMISILQESTFGHIKASGTKVGTCLLQGISPDSIKGSIIENVPLTLGQNTYLHTFCFAPINIPCILGIDFLGPVGAILDFNSNFVSIDGEKTPIYIDSKDDDDSCKVFNVRRVVVPPQSVGYLQIGTEKDFANGFVFEPSKLNHCLVSAVFGKGNKVMVKVINDSDKYRLFKRDAYLGQAEPAELLVHPVDMVDNAEVKVNSSNSQQTTKLPEHLSDMFKKATKNLDPGQQKKFKDLLIEFQSVFSKDNFDLGCLQSVEHQIVTTDEIPVKDKFRRTPLKFQQQEKEYIEKLLQQGVIEPSSSDWSSAPVLVRKKQTGELRYCIDYRALNKKTVKDNFNLPIIEDCLDAMQGKKLFCVLDLCSGYYQIPLAENARSKTSFTTRFGTFQWRRLPMGLCNSPATFQRAMQLVLKGLTWEELIVYLDDLIILGTDVDNTLAILRKVFTRFRENSLKFKPSKCTFFAKEVEFLGKLVSEQGVAITPQKIDVLKNWPRPTNTKELQSFLGFLNYHRSHIKGFAKIAERLYELSNERRFIWTDDDEQAFIDLKEAAINAPLLSHPTLDGTFILDVDASGKQIGGALYQIQDRVVKPISFGSYVLMPGQRKYCTTRKELLALVRFCRTYRHYLLGRPFLVRTDHNSLVWLTRFKHIEGQLARWLEELSQYNMTIVHRKGCEHINADALSRIGDTLKSCDCYNAGADLKSLPCGGCAYCTRAHNQWSRFAEDVDDVIPLAMINTNTLVDVPLSTGSSNWVEGLTSGQLRDAQLQDPDIGLVIHWLEHGYLPSKRELLLTSPETRALWSCRSNLEFSNGVLFYLWSEHPSLGSRLCVVVPYSLRKEVLQNCHDSRVSGHLGIDKTRNKLKDKFFWYGMSRDAELHVRGCHICNRNKKGNVTPRAGQRLYHAGYPMERVHIDILGPFHVSSKGNRYILVMVDQFTKWVELAAIPEQNAQMTVKSFVDRFVSTFGCPLEIHSDQGRNFESNLFQAFCKLLEITKTRTTPYRPCSNGQCEVYNRVILQIIRSFISKDLKDWDAFLPFIAMALHSMKNHTTGFTANMMMLGRETIQPLDLMIGQVDLSPVTEVEWVRDLLSKMSEIHRLAREKIGQTQLRQKRDYDLRLKERTFNLGDPVYLRDSSTKVGVSTKLRPPWLGPFLITSSNPPLYEITSNSKTTKVHHDRLKLCRDSDLPLWLKRKRHSLLSLDPELTPPDIQEESQNQSEASEPDQLDESEMETDLDQTLPYMLPDESDPEPLDPSGSEVDLNPKDLGPPQTTTTRTGREVRLPARYRE